MDRIGAETLDLPVSVSEAGSQEDIKFVLKKTFIKILRRAEIDDDDNFFDLGGDSILAIALFSEIEKMTGQLLPLTALYEAPSVNTLARLLAEDAKPDFPCLALLKSGTPAPFFFIPGIGGTVMELRQLARLTKIKQTIYGFDAPGLDGKGPTYNRVEDLARFYFETLVAIQPEGPYYLAGYSFGGLVALEIALMLSKTGKRVALLALIDTFPSVKFWPLSCRVTGMIEILRSTLFEIPWFKVVGHYVSTLRSLPLHSAIGFIIAKSARCLTLPFNNVEFAFWLSRHSQAGTPQFVHHTDAERLNNNLQKVKIGLSEAFKSYKPKYYPNELTFIRADGTKFFDVKPFWEKLCTKLTIYAAPGDHYSMVRMNSQPLADVLTICVERASQPASAQQVAE